MSEVAAMTPADFVLPTSVVTKLDVSRLVSELEQLDNELTAASVRASTGTTENVNPVMSTQLADFLEQNKLALTESHERTEIIKQARLLKYKVPVIQMTFAVTADAESLQQITQWLRTSVHPQAVIAVGLQPSLVAGVYVRTPNHVHDLSLRAAFDGSRDVLVKELESLRGSR